MDEGVSTADNAPGRSGVIAEAGAGSPVPGPDWQAVTNPPSRIR
jgi:hypothetical protein